MKFATTLSLIFLHLVIQASTLFAASNTKTENKTNSLTYTIIALDTLVPDQLYVKDRETYKPLKIRHLRRSPSYKIINTKTFQLYEKTDNPESPYRLLGKTSLANASKRCLFFIKRNKTFPQQGHPYSILRVNDTQTRFPEGSFQFINFMETPIIVEFQKKKTKLLPGRGQVIQTSATEDGEFNPILFKNVNNNIVGGTRIFTHAKNRELVLIMTPKQGKKRPRIHYFSDSIIPESL